MARRPKASGLNPAPAPSAFPDFQAEDDHRTLQRAGEVMASPPRLAAVRRHHRKTTGAVDRMLGAKAPPTFGGRR